jgi:hypothetical protein
MNPTPSPSQSPWARLSTRLDPTVPFVVKDAQAKNPDGQWASPKGLHIQRVWIDPFGRSQQGAYFQKELSLAKTDLRHCYRPVCQWETTLLTQLNTQQVKSRQKLVTLEEKNDGVSSPSGVQRDQNNGTARLFTLTKDLGPDLNQWTKVLRWCPHEKQAVPVLYEPRHILELLKAILTALKAHHDVGFVHCDLHWGNIALPAAALRQEHRQDGAYWLVRPLWANVTPFDWDGGASQHMSPPIMPFMFGGLYVQVGSRFVKKELVDCTPQDWQLARQDHPDPYSLHLRLRLAYLKRHERTGL